MNSSIAAATVPHFVAFDSSHKSAATVVFVFALLSTLVLSIVLLGVVWVVSSVALKRAGSENLAREVFFFRSQLGQYACSLLLSKWISCLGGLISIKWVNEGGITTGMKVTCPYIRDTFTLIVTFRRTILLYPRCPVRGRGVWIGLLRSRDGAAHFQHTCLAQSPSAVGRTRRHDTWMGSYTCCWYRSFNSVGSRRRTTLQH
jgi:hypothetical protein